MSVVKIILVDDHILVRAGIRALLDKMPGVSVIAEADDGEEVFALVEEFRPDIVLMDIAMSGLNGIETTQEIRRRHPQTEVIILSMHSNEEYVMQALRAGAKGYILKDSAVRELKKTIEEVSRGETYMSPTVSRLLVDYMQRTSDDPKTVKQLTPRQREVLQMLVNGQTTQEIANVLGISTKTVESHRSQMMERLKIYDIPGLVRYAMRLGLITSDK